MWGLQLPHKKKYTHYVFLALPYCLASLFSSHISIPFYLFTLLNRQDFRSLSLIAVYIVGYTVRSQAGLLWFLTLNIFVFLSTEQRKKYSNSNFIMHETSQYHVEVRSALFLFLFLFWPFLYFKSFRNKAKYL